MPELTLDLEYLTQTSQRIWRSTSFETMLALLMDAGKESFGICSAHMFDLVACEGQIQITEKDTDLGVARLASATVLQSIEVFKSLPLKSQELRTGLHVVAVGNHQIEFALFGDPAADWSLVAWERNSSERIRKEGNLDQAWDFLLAQVQSGSLWCRRLDKTQALLHRDDLTNLFNHRYLEAALQSEILRSSRFNAPFAILFIDLDNLKPINDTHGHLSGSGVLKQFADVLRETLREVDSVARYGGDEFVVMLLGATTSVAALVAERLRKQVAAHQFMTEHGEPVELTCSIGLSAFPKHGRDKEQLLRKADESMYVSKRMGKNRVTTADELSKHIGLGEVYETSRFEKE